MWRIPVYYLLPKLSLLEKKNYITSENLMAVKRGKWKM